MLKIFCNYCDTEITKDNEVGTFVHIKEKKMFLDGKNQNQGGQMVKEKTETHLCFRCIDKVLKALK